MKMITVIIKPERLTQVKEALFASNISKMTVSNGVGAGKQGGFVESYRGKQVEVNLVRNVRIEIAVNDEFVDQTVQTIIEGGRTGKIGDGKIFIREIEQCVRIRTGETGESAIG